MSKLFIKLKLLLRNRLKCSLILVLLFSCIFIISQFLYFNQLNEQSKVLALIRGTHIRQIMFYIPNDNNRFTCIESKEEVDYHKVNDDYCDCLDGSDEPGTNACSNGRFFCTHQDSTKKHRNFVPSTMVNDGVCDCCDGSDEWEMRRLHFQLTDKIQSQIGRYVVPCKNIC